MSQVMSSSTKIQTEPTSVVLDLTPSSAKALLEACAPNRSLRQSLVDRYARDMAEGRWQLTHQGILIDSQERLRDGQHRLQAIIQSGVTVRMMVTTGIDHCSEIDNGLRRTVADYL